MKNKNEEIQKAVDEATRELKAGLKKLIRESREHMGRYHGHHSLCDCSECDGITAAEKLLEK